MDTRPQQGNVSPVDPVAIIGMAFRLPGEQNTPSSFWEFIKSAKVAIRHTPADRFDVEAYYSPDPDRSGTTYSRRAGYISDPYGFDPDFFRISMAEAREMDPQQRWMLQLCWSALEHAGIVPSELSGRRVGLFLTAGDVDYARRTVSSGDPHRISFYGKLGTNRAVGVGRVAFTLGLQGPAIFLDSTCSSSLVAVHLAAQSLRCGDCDLAIAGGINLILSPEETIGFARLRAMSPSDACRPFDSRADGYIRGEGGAVVVLKRSQEAASDNDRIEALLVGSSINNDGPSNGLTAPNGAAQEAVIRQALAHAGAKPDDVVYVEAHGTGTPLGDPIELSALRNAYTSAGTRRTPLLLGALKAQIGHLEVAAGIAALIKAILVLRHQYVPQQASFDTPNPRFRWDGALMEVPRLGRALPVEGHLVGVSAFGISGTNAHALLAPPPRTRVIPQQDRTRVLTISARSPAALRELSAAYMEPLGQPKTGLRDLCYTASVRRQHWDHRLAIVGANREGMSQALREFESAIPSGRWHARCAVPKTRLAFLFPGQGCWRPGVGAALYRDNPIFRSAVDDCIVRLSPEVAPDVQCAILDDDPKRARHRPGQLAHFILLHSLARTWIRLGVKPDVVIGHSLGEHAAAAIAGVMSLDDGLKAVEARGRLFEELRSPGAMLAVAAAAEWLRETLNLGEDLFVAAINGPEQTVLSGTASAIAATEQALVGRGLRVSRVQTYDTPGHSPLLAPILSPFRQALGSIRLKLPEIEIISTVTGRIAGSDMATADYWVDMVQQPVLFQTALATIAGKDFTFLEVGPGTTLSNLAKAASGDWTRAISSLCDGPDGNEALEPDGFAHACARLYCAGHSPDWGRLYGSPPSPAEIPTYAFEAKHIELPALTRNAGTAPADRAPAAQPPPSDVETGAVWFEAPELAAIDAILETVKEIVRPVSGRAMDLDHETALVALGFDSLALMEMRVGLQRQFGRALPMGMLAAGASLRAIAAFYSNSTIVETEQVSQHRTQQSDGARHSAVEGGGVLTAARHVVDVIGAAQAGTEAPRLSPSARDRHDNRDLVVTLRDGVGMVVALIHPVGGDVLCYGELAAAWPDDAKVVGIRHPEAEAGIPCYRSVAQLAELYRRAVVDALGTPPEIVGGWSFGGAVAHEMALQWQEEGCERAGVVVIDSPLPDGARVARARELICSIDQADDGDLLGQLISHPDFPATFDEQHGLGRLQRLVDPDIADRLLRIHAANAIALVRHRPHPIGTPYWYALALRSDNARSCEEALERIAPLSAGSTSALGFDCDHFSIMRAPAVQGVAGFLGIASKRLRRIMQMVAE
jgi:acyl transferase domain-containing protein/thioesterase domain-containing protein